MQINMKDCASSQVNSFGYDPTTGTLAVKFQSGATYHYTGVTPVVYEAMYASESVGKFIGQQIKGKYDFSKQVEEKDDK